MNYFLMSSLDIIYTKGSSIIDTIAAFLELIIYIEDSQLCKTNKIILIDY